ncbi:NACHT domain-containing protein [Streptomyces laurentii]|uniref:NACHT domain-containing protein n=1 Tax=Streptomyces laurentii TaxID=39478 RepID=UPI0036B7FD98
MSLELPEMLEVVAAKIATAIFGTAVGAATRSLIPGPGAGIAPAPMLPRLRLKRPNKVEEADIKRLAEHVQKGLESYLRDEFRDLAGNERQAALDLTVDSFTKTTADIWALSLDPQAYAATVIRQSERNRKAAALSEMADSLYEVLVYRTALQVVQFISSWSTFSARTDIEILKRLNLLTEAVEKIQDGLGQDLRSDDIEFETRYCALIEEALDRLQIFGIDLADRSNRSYNLTAAYITLSVAQSSGTSGPSPDLFGEVVRSEIDAAGAESSSTVAPLGMKAEAAIANLKRILLRGDAGSGKTTLLQWLSVNVARKSLEGGLASWNTLVPFILPLRRFANKPLPSPGEFFPEVGTHLADEMPDKWVNRILRAGRALVLIDGVDELPNNQRDEARKWLRELIRTYPNATYVVTSRPAAAESDWLAQDGFSALDMLPMSHMDVENFVQHWHSAAATAEANQQELSALKQGEADLISSIKEERQLKRLASNPLLCALLCTLNRDRHSQLPKDRMELYRAALDMLLLRRDRERRIEYPEPPNVGDAQKKSILGGFAYWLIRNGLSDSAQDQAVNQVEISLSSMPSVSASADEVFDYLLVRSGCLRRPIPGRVDFVHRTFQEFLAAARIVEVDDLEVLVNNAHLDQWHEVVVMAVGHARPKERTMILSRLLERGDREAAVRSRLHLLAAACLETAGECDPQVHERVREATARLIPPRKMSDAKEIASAGEMVIPLIPERRLSAPEAAATVRMASIVGGDGALSLISRLGRDTRVTVKRELERAWQYFEVEEYAQKVMGQNADAWKEVSIGAPEMLSTVRHFPRLKTLDVFCSADTMDWLPELRDLRVLMLRAAIKEFAFSSLSRCPNITRLVVTAATVLDGFDSLVNLRHLKHLATYIQGGVEISEFPKLDSLRSFNFHGSGPIDISAIASAFQGLEDLTLGSSASPNFPGLLELRRLRTLTVSNLLAEHARAISRSTALTKLTIRSQRIDQTAWIMLADSPILRTIVVSPHRGLRGDIDIRPFLERSDISLTLWLGRGSNVLGLDDPRVAKHGAAEYEDDNLRVLRIEKHAAPSQAT